MLSYLYLGLPKVFLVQRKAFNKASYMRKVIKFHHMNSAILNMLPDNCKLFLHIQILRKLSGLLLGKL